MWYNSLSETSHTEELNMNNVISIQKADIGIIGAMQIEVEALCAAMENTESRTVGNMTFVYGDLRGKKVVCAKCGVGKVFAAMCAQTMILQYAPDCIVNSGVAGTLSESLSIGQIALAEQVVQHDMDTSPIGDPVGLISGINLVYIPADPAVTDALAAAVCSVGVPYLRGTVASGISSSANGRSRPASRAALRPTASPSLPARWRAPPSGRYAT